MVVADQTSRDGAILWKDDRMFDFKIHIRTLKPATNSEKTICVNEWIEFDEIIVLLDLFVVLETM